MENIEKFTTFNEASTQAKGVAVRNGNSKLINDDPTNTIDLGVIDDVSDTDITNIQQTYKNSQIKTVNGHYILVIDENTIIKYSDFENLNEDGIGFFNKFFDKKPEVSEEIDAILHKKINGIPSMIGIDKFKYNQVLFAYDNDGYDSLSKEYKNIFSEMIYYAKLSVQEEL